MKVDYKKRYDRSGTCYNQTITIDFDMAYNFNKYVDELKDEVIKKIEINHYWTYEDDKILDYLEKINFYNDTFVTLTTANYFKKWYFNNIYQPPKKDVFYERLKYRNTCFKVQSTKQNG